MSALPAITLMLSTPAFSLTATSETAALTAMVVTPATSVAPLTLASALASAFAWISSLPLPRSSVPATPFSPALASASTEAPAMAVAMLVLTEP